MCLLGDQADLGAVCVSDVVDDELALGQQAEVGRLDDAP